MRIRTVLIRPGAFEHATYANPEGRGALQLPKDGSNPAYLPGDEMTARTTTVKIAAAALAALLGTAALAFAGVSLPGPAQSAFTRLGLSLPNQNEGAQPEGPPTTVPAATLPPQASDRATTVLDKLQDEGGCGFGHDTADDHATLPDGAVDACSHQQSHPSNSSQHPTPQGSPQTGVTHSSEGQLTAGAAPQGSRETGENASEIGQTNSTNAPQGGADTGQTVTSEVTPGPPAGTPPAATGPPSGTPGGRP
jgi:hypothetical protein